jgi:hypothetical protein
MQLNELAQPEAAFHLRGPHPQSGWGTIQLHARSVKNLDL